MRRISKAQWIQNAISDQEKESPCTGLAVCHYVNGIPKEVYSVKLHEGKLIDPKGLAELFEDKAYHYCQDLPPGQEFALHAYYAKDKPEAVLPFVINGDNENASWGSHTPDEKGMKQQGMTHIATMSQLYRRGLATLMEEQRIFRQDLQNELYRCRADAMAAIEITKTCMIEMVTHREEQEMKRLEFERATIERAKWLSMFPALANTVLGKEIFPLNAEDTALIESVADSLTPEDVAKLSTVLRPELMAPLANRLTKHRQKQIAEQQKMKALNASIKTENVTNEQAAEDAAGE